MSLNFLFFFKGNSDVAFIPSGIVPPTMSINVTARSIVAVGSLITASRAKPGPEQIIGTDIAECHGLLFAIVSLSPSISP